ncbi:cystathionine gamma-synthase [Colletotrichum plurivorum]|uniref:Cystathionine gamma-synthase n=1 Tax=Colletotrichum plurivorum TaxID=2175906 RepID=A0A8H6NRA6_9PEZI|nr:cystathionine gamma-synthase [Colletotrichum plurivorum]
MPVLKPTSEWGRCVPPESDHGITTYAPGWDSAVRLRESDPEILSRIVHIYPRFGPFGPVAKALKAVCAGLELPEGQAGLFFTSPVALDAARKHATHPHRKEHVLEVGELGSRCVDVGGVRLFVVTFPAAKTPGVIGVWQNPGIGVSIRLAERILGNIDTLTEVADGTAPETEYLPEVPAHGKLRERIAGLLRRAPVDEEKVSRVKAEDVCLYMTGMAAIFAAHNGLLAYRPGAVAILGIVFHSTIHYVQESCPDGYKHFGPVDGAGLDVFEAWLDEMTSDRKDVSYVFVEFPSNPLLASVDIFRLKKLSEKHGFVLVLDDTVGSFANIDVLPHCDVLVSSLTKSFSGYANVMGGSLVLNPLSAHYPSLSKLWTETFHNELYAADAEVLLKNSEDYLERTAVLNRNAAVMAAHLHHLADDPSSPVLRVLYPPYLKDWEIYRSVLRKPAPELQEPGAGCLLSVDFDSVAAARAFYDRLGFYPGPHLGAHRTLSFCYNTLAFGKDAQEAEYHRGYGLLEESVRVSAGLEGVGDLVDTLKDALLAAGKAREQVGGVEGVVGSGVAS